MRTLKGDLGDVGCVNGFRSLLGLEDVFQKSLLWTSLECLHKGISSRCLHMILGALKTSASNGIEDVRIGLEDLQRWSSNVQKGGR